MPRISTRLALFEENARNLGVFEAPIPVKIVEFYDLSYALRTHINLVTSPGILWANTNERALAVDQYEKAFRDWNKAVDEMLMLFETCCQKPESNIEGKSPARGGAGLVG